MKRKLLGKTENVVALLLALCCVFGAVGECRIVSVSAAETQAEGEAADAGVTEAGNTDAGTLTGNVPEHDVTQDVVPELTESDMDSAPESTEAAEKPEEETPDGGKNPAEKNPFASGLAAAPKSDGITVTKVELWKEGAEVKDGDGLSFTDALEVRYYFADLYMTDYTDDNGVTHPQNCTNHTAYVIGQMPNTFVWPQSGTSWDMKDGSGTKWAELLFTVSGGLELKLTAPDTIDHITGAYATFSANLNKDELGESAQTASIVFTEGGGATYEVRLVDNVPTPPAIEKHGTYDGTTNEVAWEVTLTEGSQVYEQGCEIRDIFDEKQELVAGSIQSSFIRQRQGGTEEHGI